MSTFPKRKQIRLTHDSYGEHNCFAVTIVTYNRYPWFQFHPSLAQDLIKIMQQVAIERRTTLYAWCIMPDHLHVLVTDTSVIEFVRLIKGRSVPLARNIDASRRMWQRSFHDHALRREEAIIDVARYIFANPVRAQLVKNPTEYPLSGSNVWPEWKQHQWGNSC